MRKKILSMSIAAVMTAITSTGVMAFDTDGAPTSNNDGPILVQNEQSILAGYQGNLLPEIDGTAANTPNPNQPVESATRLSLSANGLGDALIFPMFNQADNWGTEFVVRNTDQDRAIVAKVAVYSFDDSEEVLDFNVYLSAADVVRFRIENGNLITEDGSVLRNIPAPSSNLNDVALSDFASSTNPFTRELNIEKGYVVVYGMAQASTQADPLDSFDVRYHNRHPLLFTNYRRELDVCRPSWRIGHQNAMVNGTYTRQTASSSTVENYSVAAPNQAANCLLVGTGNIMVTVATANTAVATARGAVQTLQTSVMAANTAEAIAADSEAQAVATEAAAVALRAVATAAQEDARDALDALNGARTNTANARTAAAAAAAAANTAGATANTAGATAIAAGTAASIAAGTAAQNAGAAAQNAGAATLADDAATARTEAATARTEAIAARTAANTDLADVDAAAAAAAAEAAATAAEAAATAAEVLLAAVNSENAANLAVIEADRVASDAEAAAVAAEAAAAATGDRAQAVADRAVADAAQLVVQTDAIAAANSAVATANQGTTLVNAAQAANINNIAVNNARSAVAIATNAATAAVQVANNATSPLTQAEIDNVVASANRAADQVAQAAAIVAANATESGPGNFFGDVAPSLTGTVRLFNADASTGARDMILPATAIANFTDGNKIMYVDGEGSALQDRRIQGTEDNRVVDAQWARYNEAGIRADAGAFVVTNASYNFAAESIANQLIITQPYKRVLVQLGNDDGYWQDTDTNFGGFSFLYNVFNENEQMDNIAYTESPHSSGISILRNELEIMTNLEDGTEFDGQNGFALLRFTNINGQNSGIPAVITQMIGTTTGGVPQVNWIYSQTQNQP